MTADLVDARLGALIRRYRQAADLSPADFAAGLHRTAQWIRDVEAGCVRISSIYLREISDALGVGIDELFACADKEPIIQPAPKMALVVR